MTATIKVTTDVKNCRIDEQRRNIDRNNREYSRIGVYGHISSRLSVNVFVALSQVYEHTRGIKYLLAQKYLYVST